MGKVHLRADRFAEDRRGAVAVLFAIGILTIALCSGLAVDYSIGMSARLKNQAALDAALLAAATTSSSQAEAEDNIAKYYAANGGLGSIGSVQYKKSHVSVTVSAQANYEKINYFGGLVDMPKSKVRVASEVFAKPKLTELTIEPISATGAWSKIMTLHMIDDATGTDTTLGYIDYLADPGLSTGKVTTDMKGSVSLINAREAYFRMDINDDPTKSTYTENISQTVMRTNDSKTSHHVFVDGVQLTKGVAVNLADIIPCEKQVLVSWEDGGNFSAQDFFFKVTGECTISAGSVAVLKR